MASPDNELWLVVQSLSLPRERCWLKLRLIESMVGLQVDLGYYYLSTLAEPRYQEKGTICAPPLTRCSTLAAGSPNHSGTSARKVDLHLGPWCTHCAGAPVRLYSGCPGGRDQ